MTLKPYLIAPFNSGLQNEMESWMLPEDAFSTLENAYVWRGRVKKRFGTNGIGVTSNLSRLRINLGPTDGAGALTIAVPGTVFAIGQNFSIGTEFLTVTALGTPGTLISTGSSTTKTFNTTSGQLVIAGATAATDIFFYPSTPVMGLKLRETPETSVESTVGFDTQFAYERSGGGWRRIGAKTWTGTDKDFYWTTNYRGINPYETYLYVVNGIETDGIQFLPFGSSTWASLNPQLNTGGQRKLENSKIIIGFKDRLVVLNTIESNTVANTENYVNRARWCQNGTPVDNAISWLDDTPGRGGYNDAPTKEAIISCEFIKDRLIVYFEKSTWELVYIADPALPFIWQQLNNELGCESRFSIVGFDKGAIGVGNVGIHTCNGVNVSRIDQVIPDEVFKIHNGNSGPERVYGIRDFYREIVYWTFPDATDNPTYPTSILVWNYQNNTWAKFEDSYTCFGYFQQESDLTWAKLSEKYGTWEEWNDPWGSGSNQSQFPDIIAGNQQGFVATINTDKTSNSQSLSITDITLPNTLTVVNHNLDVGSYILIEGALGITSDLNELVFQVLTVPSSSTITIDTEILGTYTGGGAITRVSNINVQSKQWNPGTAIGQQIRMPYIDFLMDRTSDGEVSLNYLIDTSSSSLQDTIPTGVLLGSNVVSTRPEPDVPQHANQNKIWHRYFLLSQGSFIQIKFFYSDAQMRNQAITNSAFQLNGIILYVEPNGRITG